MVYSRMSTILKIMLVLNDIMGIYDKIYHNPFVPLCIIVVGAIILLFNLI